MMIDTSTLEPGTWELVVTRGGAATLRLVAVPCPPDCPECQFYRDILADKADEDREAEYPQPPTPRRREYLAATLRAARKCDRCPPHGGNDNGRRKPRPSRPPKGKRPRRG